MTSLVSPGYAPFEQYHEADGKQGPWTDIYALGATCYCAITGKPPPEALKRGMMQFEHNTDVYLELADIKSGKYSDALLEAIDCALRFREVDRPQSVTEWKRMITGGETVPELEERTQPEEAPTKAVRKKRSVWPLLRKVAIVLLIVGAGGYLYSHQAQIKQQVTQKTRHRHAVHTTKMAD